MKYLSKIIIFIKYNQLNLCILNIYILIVIIYQIISLKLKNMKLKKFLKKVYNYFD